SSIVLYVLVGFIRGDRRSNEALMKFFLVGSFSGILILFGAALLYGLTGSTNLYDHKYILSSFTLYHPIAAVALTMIAAGMGFKLAIAPFHTWAPDTYEGAPTPITAFISVAPKAGAVCVWIRFFLLGLAPLKLQWVLLVAVLSATTLIVGNLGALHQMNLKRLLAYSSISHMGYVLMGICAAALQPLAQTGITLESETQGFFASVFYMLTYLFFNLGAFAVICLLETRGIAPNLQEYRGLGRRSPLLAVMMSIFMLALAGLPPTSGFPAKFIIFRAALASRELLWLVIVAGVMTVVALYYYVKVIYYMWLAPADDGAEPLPNIPLSDPQGLAIVITTGAVLLMFIMPTIFYEFANKSSFLNYSI
ncbi:MAG: NADH-quinone oxidoreductase subunit N, partial [bacterium]